MGGYLAHGGGERVDSEEEVALVAPRLADHGPKLVVRVRRNHRHLHSEVQQVDSPTSVD